jgi:hypothetical protein
MKSWLQLERILSVAEQPAENDDCGLREAMRSLAKTKPMVFSATCKAALEQVRLVQLKPRSFETNTFRRLLDTRME